MDCTGLTAEQAQPHVDCVGFEEYAAGLGVKLDRDGQDPPGMWDNIEKHGSFYADLPTMPDALELWRGAKALHPNPVILTGVPRITNVEEHKRSCEVGAGNRVRVAQEVPAPTCHYDDRDWSDLRDEVLLLYSELRRYQLHGIKYPRFQTMAERRLAYRQREREISEARQLMGLEPWRPLP